MFPPQNLNIDLEALSGICGCVNLHCTPQFSDSANRFQLYLDCLLGRRLLAADR